MKYFQYKKSTFLSSEGGCKSTILNEMQQDFTNWNSGCYFFSSNIEKRSDCKKERSKLNNKAHQIFETAKPLTK
jgi:hypothetical protein